LPGGVLRWFLSCAVLILGLTVAAHAADLEISAGVEPNPIELNGQFTLTVTLSGSGASSISQVDLPQMQSFAAFLGSSSSQSIQLINGTFSSSKSFQYVFQATAVGKFRIETMTVDYDGKSYQTQPIDFEVLPASQGSQSQSGRTVPREPIKGLDSAALQESLFIRAVPSKTKVYVNEAAVLSYTLYTRVAVSRPRFSKLPASTGFWVEDYDIQEPPSAVATVGGRQYQTYVLRRVALFPMTAGDKTIEPLELECDVRVQRRGRSPFDSIFDDPFFADTRTVAIESEPVRITVMPLPSEGKPADFSGCVGDFKVAASVDKRSARTGEAITYRLTIEGEGNISTVPEPKVDFPPDFEKYPPKSSQSLDRQSSSIRGKKVYEYVLIPRAAGPHRIKPFSFSYFDAAGGGYRTISTDEIVVDVEKGNDAVPYPATGLSKEEVRLVGRDIRYIKTADPQFQRIGRRIFESAGFWLLLVTPLAALGGAVLFRRHLDRMAGDRAYARQRRASSLARKRLAKARAALRPGGGGEFYAEASRALQGFLGDKLDIPEAGMLSDEVRAALLSRGVSDEVIAAYFDCLQVCDLKRFSPGEATEEEMRLFLDRVEQAMSRLERAL